MLPVVFSSCISFVRFISGSSKPLNMECLCNRVWINSDICGSSRSLLAWRWIIYNGAITVSGEGNLPEDWQISSIEDFSRAAYNKTRKRVSEAEYFKGLAHTWLFSTQRSTNFLVIRRCLESCVLLMIVQNYELFTFFESLVFE